jgi:multidrug efflux pump subunit AcrA (membrane-fusion protein)
MAERDPAVSVQRLREAVAVRVRYRSLRQVAREVGMSPTGLGKFMAGGQPYSATRVKLERWYVRERLPEETLSADAAALALRSLTDALPLDASGAVERRLLEVLTDAYAATPAGVPSWLKELQRRA